MIIPDNQSKIMRGWAIMFIALHNFFHLEEFGLAQENETLFSLERTSIFFQNLFSCDQPLIGNLFSFIGWCGVPVFVFFSGYGLSKKYGKENKIEIVAYLKHSYLKLFCLILPAAIFFLVYRAFFVSLGSVALGCVSLTFLNTLVPGLGSIAPPFWYFSLTFQLYILYILLFRIKDWRKLAGIGVLFFLIYIILSPDFYPNAAILKYIRLNFIGWLTVFILGLIIGHYKHNKNENEVLSGLENNILFRWLALVIMVLCFAGLFLVNKSYYSWILLPFVSLCFFYSFTIAIEKIPLLNTMSIWLGKKSSYVFVAHPIALLAMQWILKVSVFSEIHLYVISTIYTALFILIAILYENIHIWISKKLLK